MYGIRWIFESGCDRMARRPQGVIRFAYRFAAEAWAEAHMAQRGARAFAVEAL